MTHRSMTPEGDPFFETCRNDLAGDHEAIAKTYFGTTEKDRDGLEDSDIDPDAPCGTAHEAEAEIAANRAADAKELADLQAGCRQAQNAVDDWRIGYDIGRPYVPPNLFVLFVWALALLGSETAGNTSFLFDAGVSGLIPVLFIALTLSLINLGGAFMASRWALNLRPINAGWLKRLLFLFGLLVLLAAVFAMNLGFGDYRANVVRPGEIDLGDLLRIDILRPILEPTYEAWMAVALGLFIFAVSWWKFAEQWETCIGFARDSKALMRLQRQIQDFEVAQFERDKVIVDRAHETLDGQAKDARETEAEALKAAGRIERAGVRRDHALTRANTAANATYAAYCQRKRSTSRVPGDLPRHYFDPVDVASYLPPVEPAFDPAPKLEQLKADRAKLMTNISIERARLAALLTHIAPKEIPHVDQQTTDPRAPLNLVPAQG